MRSLMPLLKECYDPLNPKYRFFVLPGTAMNGFNTAYMKIYTAEMAIDEGHLYTVVEDTDTIRLANEEDLPSMETDEPGLYGGILYLEELEYVNPADDPNIAARGRCPHCGEAIRVALG